MADIQQFPTQSSLARRHKLNPIIEEDSDDGYVQRSNNSHQARRVDTSHLKIEAWLSPMSDHFPTPRGIHYLAAPVLPSSPSASSTNDTSPTTSSSNAWNRVSIGTQNTEFEDLYDVSDEEDYGAKGLQRRSSVRKSTASGRQPMRIVIPNNSAAGDARSALEEFKKITSPIALTPSAQLTMSPAQLNFMGKQQALEIPTISAPPSLDGSLSSEQLAAMSAPPTPVIGNDESSTEQAWSGVRLQPDALATLHALSSGSDDGNLEEQPARVIELPEIMQQPQAVVEMRQQPLRLITNFQPLAGACQTFSPNPTRHSLADLTKLDIPSPGGFFDALSPRTRSTWHMLSKDPEPVVPPTSTTAEQFYRCPWNMDASVPPVPERPDSAEGFYRSMDLSNAPVQQVVEVNDDILGDDMPTARPIMEHKDSDETIKAPASPEAEDIPTEIVAQYDGTHARQQQEEALSNLDRTEMWLLAQRAYLKPVDDKEDNNGLETISEDAEETEEEALKVEIAPVVALQPEAEQAVVPRKKSVRFSELASVSAQPKRLPSKFARQESAYYRAFQDYVVRAHSADVFVHQLTRFEALQAQRVSLRESHRNQLLGKYQLSVVPQSAKKRLSTNVVRGDDTITDDLEKLRLEKEFEAAAQMAMPTWHVAAMKFLNGGRLITAPVTKRLARLSCMAPGKDGVTRDRARILDLGGQSTCDWAWHCALQYPNTKVYTVTTKSIRQLSNSNIRGPSNHRQVAVDRLTRLPFGDNQFDLVYARELHSILKFTGENGEDEWEGCLKECMRVLKPGGYIEFSILDSDIMNAGPLGLAKSVEFGFSLKTLGYDPSPSKMFLGRLARAGFQDTRRMWMCLPVGAKRNMHKMDVASPEEAAVMGSTDNIASACGIVGGWNWERWLLRCEMEKVAGELRLADTVTTGEAMKEAGQCLDGVAAVMEEGRNHKAGFRMLNGYARKPRDGEDVIQIALAQ